MTDSPIAFAKDGKPLYDNVPTVVCVLLHDFQSFLAIRRNTDPGKGLIALPGGFHMRGESWQECGAREVYEETGMFIDPNRLDFQFIETDEYDHNLIVASYNTDPIRMPKKRNEAEVQEYLIHTLNDVPPVCDWAFSMHYVAVRDLKRHGYV